MGSPSLDAIISFINIINISQGKIALTLRGMAIVKLHRLVIGRPDCKRAYRKSKAYMIADQAGSGPKIGKFN
jgi:hypothetical protein